MRSGYIGASILFLVILALFSTRSNADPSLSWQAPTHDVFGNPLGGSARLEYWLYARQDAPGSNFTRYVSVDRSPIDLTEAPPGCYELYVTAVIVNSGAESDPSETIVACINLPCGEVGTDGTVGECAGNGDQPGEIVPEPPKGVQIRITGAP